MGLPTPSWTTVLDAIEAALSGIVPSIGTIKKHETPLEDEAEYIDDFQDSDGKLDLWLIENPSIDETEGEATGENYSIYNFMIRYFSVRVGAGAEDWSREAILQSEIVRDELNKKASIFAIGGQRHVLETPETVSMASAAFVTIGEEGHRVYEIQLTLSVEAQRFS